MPIKIKEIEQSGGGIKSGGFEIVKPKEGVYNSETYKKGVAIQNNIESSSKDSIKSK